MTTPTNPPWPPYEAVRAAMDAIEATPGTVWNPAISNAILAALPHLGLAGLLREAAEISETAAYSEDSGGSAEAHCVATAARLRAAADKIETNKPTKEPQCPQ